jgi:hypothetical protein
MTVLKKIGHVLLVIALVAMIGGHWAVLQTVAWSTMLADNLRVSSFSEAVERTFDGKHPCTLCKQISAGKKAEKKTEISFGIKKLEFVSNGVTQVFKPFQSFYLLQHGNDSVREFTHQPLAPPPRPLAA